MRVGFYSYSFGAPRPVVRRRVVLAYPVPAFHPLRLAGHLAEQPPEEIAVSIPSGATSRPRGTPEVVADRLLSEERARRSRTETGTRSPGTCPRRRPDAPSHVFSKNSVDERSKNSKPPADPVDFASVSSVSSRDSSTNSRGSPGHWRNFLTMRSHLRRTTPFSSGAVRHEYCARRDEGRGSASRADLTRRGSCAGWGRRWVDAHRGRA